LQSNSLTGSLARKQHKKLYSLEMELAAARNKGFVLKQLLETNGIYFEGKPLVMIGVITTFGRQKNRDAIRNVWMGSVPEVSESPIELDIFNFKVLGVALAISSSSVSPPQFQRLLESSKGSSSASEIERKRRSASLSSFVHLRSMSPRSSSHRCFSCRNTTPPPLAPPPFLR
ncbi:hypothetical protein HN51_059125, partial [Arachis hypogaea]